MDLTNHSQPTRFVAEGVPRGLRWWWLAAGLWMLLAVFCVHLILGVAQKQSEITASIDWWRKAEPYHDDVVILTGLAAQRHLDAETLLEAVPPRLTEEIRTQALRYSIPLAGAVGMESVQLWTAAEADVSSALGAFENEGASDPSLLLDPATQLASGIAQSMRRVTGHIADRSVALDTERFWLYLVAVLSVLGAGGLIVLHRFAEKKQIALTLSRSALAISEARYRNMFQENRTVQMVIHPGTRRIVDANGAACAFYRASFEQLTSMRMSDLIDRTGVVDPQHQRQGEDGEMLIERHRTTDGTMRHVEVRTSPFEGHGRRLLYAIIHDVQDQIEARDARRATEERLSATIAAMADAVLVVNNEGVITLTNSAAGTLLGLEHDALIGQSLVDRYSVRDSATREFQHERIEALARSGVAARAPFTMVLTQQSGAEILVSEASAHLQGPDGTVEGAVFVVRDVTEQRRLETESLRAERFQSLGVLAGGIAHDFNNILTGVFGHVAMAKTCSEDAEKVEARLARANEALGRARDLTGRLMTFAKGGAPLRRAAPLDELIQEAVRFAVRGSHVAAHVSIADDLESASVDQGQVHQVLHNMLINACQAMPEGGEVRVRAENTRLEVGQVAHLPAGRYIRIEVEDEGTGIPAENLERVFEPYFTTKEAGSGLGLASAFSVVRNHDGHIEVQSVLGSGTTFTIYLPATDQAIEEADPEAAVALPRGGMRILLLDDDDDVRLVMREQLEGLQYEVDTVATAEDAVRVYGEALEVGQPHDLVILDLLLPGGPSGQDVLDTLVSLDPTIRAVACSGQASHASMRDPRRNGFCATLPKPFTGTELETLLAKVLGESAVLAPGAEAS